MSGEEDRSRGTVAVEEPQTSTATSGEVLLVDDLPMPEVAAMPPELAAAVVAAWAELGALTKGRTAEVKMREGGTYSYTYADLADLLELVRPVLARHGLALLQPITRESATGILVIETWLLHASGWLLRWRFAVQATGSPQAIGSSITYGRRYAATSALGVAAEDDDGAAATKATPAPAPAKAAPRTTTRRPASSPREALNRRVHALFRAYGLGGDDLRDARLAYSADVVGRSIGTSNDLTEDELRAVIDRLEVDTLPQTYENGEEGP